MALQYITDVAAKANPWSSKPVLTEEDEAFLQRVTSNPDNGGDDVLPSSDVVTTPLGRDAQLALMDGAQDIPLPMSPSEEIDRELPEQTANPRKDNEKEGKSSAAPAKKKKPWRIWMKKGNGETQSKKVRIARLAVLSLLGI